jgi:hypothetical protein
MEEDNEETPPLLHRNNPPDSEEEPTIPLSEKDRRKCHADKRQTLRDEEGEILLANILQENEERYERERLSKPKRKRKRRTRKPKVTPISEDANHIHLLQESECRIKTLRSKLEHLRAMNKPTPDPPTPQPNNSTDTAPRTYPKPYCTDVPDEQEDTDDIHVLGDVHQTPFEIDRGVNESPRVTNPFSDE